MRTVTILLFFLFLAIHGLAPAQGGYSRRRSTATVQNGPSHDPAVTFYGKIKTITRKEITIDLDSEEQTLTMRRSGKTKFSHDGQEVKAVDIPAGAHVAIDAILEPDQKLAAFNVLLSPP